MSDLPDLDSLALLVAVGELGSLGQAARAAGIAQPSASKRIAVLERRLGVPLLDRSPRGSVLTEQGRLVAGWADQVLGSARELMRGVAALRESRAAALTVASSLTIAESLIPRWLHDLQEELPELRVGLSVVNSTEVAQAVLAGEAEVGFVEGPGTPPGLARRMVARDRLAVVVAPDHPWARRRTPLRATELAATALVVREPGSGTRDTLERALRGLPTARPAAELGANSAVKGAAAAGVAPAVLSGLAVEAELAAGRLTEVPVIGMDLGRSLRMVWPHGRRLIGPAADLLRIALRSRG